MDHIAAGQAACLSYDCISRGRFNPGPLAATAFAQSPSILHGIFRTLVYHPGMKTLILSDLHLGSKHSHTKHILDILEREPFDRLILNGDTIHSLNLRKFKPGHWRVLDRLRTLARSREVILLRGNHDHEGPGQEVGFRSQEVLPTLLGVPMVEEYQLKVGDQPYLVLHGDRFDPILNHSVVSELAGWCYGLSQKFNKKLAKWLKKKSKKWSGLLDWIRAHSVRHAQEQGFVGVVTGHTHFADSQHVGNIHYVNTGCWTEPPCAYAIAGHGGVQLHEVPD